MKNILYIIFGFLFILFLLTGCGLKQPNNTMLENKNILMVIAPKDFRDAEYNEPRKIFEKSGANVKVASIQGGRSIGAEGMEVDIDITVSDVNISDYDAVVFIGGPGMAEIVNDDSLQILAKKFYSAGKLTAAICVAPVVLARAGVLESKKATSWPGVKKDLKQGGANFTSGPVVTDGNIITADGPASAKKFGEAIMGALK